MTDTGEKLRFNIGTRVECYCMSQWLEGTVVKQWYKEPTWPAEKPPVPYQVNLDAGPFIFAPQDIDLVIRSIYIFIYFYIFVFLCSYK